MAYKKKLSIFQINSLAKQHKDSPIFVTNDNGDCQIEAWLKELRFKEAWQIAELVLTREISESEFQRCWQNAPKPENKKSRPKSPNTATFGGYRHRRRSALNRATKGRTPKKNRRW